MAQNEMNGKSEKYNPAKETKKQMVDKHLAAFAPQMETKVFVPSALSNSASRISNGMVTAKQKKNWNTKTGIHSFGGVSQTCAKQNTDTQAQTKLTNTILSKGTSRRRFNLFPER